jgi:hypothetical protein
MKPTPPPDNKVLMYSIDAATGALTQVPGNPIYTGTGIITIAATQ